MSSTNRACNDDDEEDYMSPSFLLNTALTDDTEHAKPRRPTKLNTESKHSLRVKRHIQLKQKLDDSNKGMQLLKKLGFKEGSGLGKLENGIVEPIPIHDARPIRAGIGAVELFPPPTFDPDSTANLSADVVENELTNNDSFRHSKSAQFTEILLIKDAKRARRLLHQLDTEKDESGFSYMWPIHLQPLPANAEHPVVESILDPLTQSIAEPDGFDANSGDSLLVQIDQLSEEARAFEMMPAVDQLNQLLDTLRTRYFHCIYCGIQYTTESELTAACPGAFRNDH